MEIEIGEYARTKDGFIRKIDKIDRCSICKEKEYISDEFIEGLHFQNTYHKKDIVKHSKNIIDLIEVGDYVNGKEVIELAKIDEEIDWLDLGDTEPIIFNDDIKSIVTKEQFEDMKYKVGD